MRKIVLLSTLALLAISITQAQIKPNVDRSKVITTVKQLPATPTPAPPPPPPVNKTTNTESGPVSVYSLTSVRVKIRTGNDNKEFPSKVFALLSIRNKPGGDWSAFSQMKLDNEMKINSDTEFGLEREAQLRGETKLDAFQSSGVKFTITYLPNFFADAWKIENISLVLEFKDQFGNLHPSLGSKTIVFSNAYGFLDNDYRLMECVTDGSFAPMTAIIKKP